MCTPSYLFAKLRRIIGKDNYMWSLRSLVIKVIKDFEKEGDVFRAIIINIKIFIIMSDFSLPPDA
jgi:hypothetical protein